MMWAIYASLMSLSLGLFTSMTFLALTHIFALIPCLYFLPKSNFKEWTKSNWSLLALIVVVILSVVFNQDISVRGYAPLTKSKYYLFGLLSIAPYSFYFKNLKNSPDHDKKITWLLWAVIGTTTLVSLSGMGAVFFGYNFLRLRAGFVDRNGGIFGMLMNYAHNMAFFLSILSGMILYRKEIKRYLNLNLLYGAWIINFLGLYTTYTRGAMLAFLVSLPFFFFKNNKKWFLVSVIAFALAGFGAYKFAGKSMVRPLSDIERVSQWKAAYAGFKERPVLGLGYLNFEQRCSALKLTYNIEAQHFCGHAHSNYFEMLASTGAVGFLFFMMWHVFWFIEMYKRDDLIARIALPFIVVFVVGGLTQATFTLGANLFLIMPVYALTQVSSRTLKNV